MTALLLLAGALSAQVDPYAAAGTVSVGTERIIVGQVLGSAEGVLDCAAEAGQKTLKRCTLKKDKTARLFGSPVDEVTLNVHYQGQVINLSAAFPSSQTSAALLQRLKAELSLKPKVQPWAAGGKLNLSYIWVDRDTEVELTVVQRGGSSSDRLRVYLANIGGNQPLHPDDQ